jgi:Co/Zn/Cd efflux system component
MMMMIVIIIIIIMGATGTISESFRTYLSNIPGKHDIKDPQKTAIVNSAHIFNILNFPCKCII